MNTDSWPLWLNIALFLAAAGLIGVAGTRMAGLADRIADRTGLGEALTGTLFLGLMTALPGIAASIAAALDGRPALAISNAIGGIAIQTASLAVADLFHRGANLEHAAASILNILQTALLIFLLTLVLVTLSGPAITIGFLHPMTLVLFAAAAFSFWLVASARKTPMWEPRQTAETVADTPEPDAQHESLRHLVLALLGTGALVLGSGVLVAEVTGNIAEQTPLSESVVGGLLTGAATSLPEVVTTIAAVRRGALTLAVSDIVGGNFFDVLFVCLADLAYLRGSLYHAPDVTGREVFLTGLAILLNVIFLIGLVYREKRGPANIGIESVLMLAVYVLGFATLTLSL